MIHNVGFRFRFMDYADILMIQLLLLHIWLMHCRKCKRGIAAYLQVLIGSSHQHRKQISTFNIFYIYFVSSSCLVPFPSYVCRSRFGGAVFHSLFVYSFALITSSALALHVVYAGAVVIISIDPVCFSCVFTKRFLYSQTSETRK